jgi:WD40 repeat protein
MCLNCMSGLEFEALKHVKGAYLDASKSNITLVTAKHSVPFIPQASDLSRCWSLNSAGHLSNRTARLRGDNFLKATVKLCQVWDRRVLKRDGKKGSPVGVLVGHVEGLTHIDSRGDGRYLITNGKDQCIKLWDMRKMVDAKTHAE